MPEAVRDVALTPAAATSPEDSRAPAMTDMPETALPATVSQYGLMEFAGVDKTARSKMGVWKMQEWTYRHDVAGVDNAGVD